MPIPPTHRNHVAASGASRASPVDQLDAKLSLAEMNPSSRVRVRAFFHRMRYVEINNYAPD
jgi:hypothetical protein